MFKELIEKLNSLKSSWLYDTKTLEMVIELSESYKPKVLDEPDIYGRWLNVNVWGHVAYFDVIENDNVFYAKTDEGIKPVNEIGGLWIHVLPETETKNADRKPKVLDKPDSEGWWWTYDEDGRLYDCFHVVESEGMLQVRDQRRNLYIKLVSEMLSNLKWQKAIMPEME